MELTKEYLTQQGSEHARLGKSCTANECQFVDKQIFDEIKRQTENIADYMDRRIKQAKIYEKLRGHFNKAWQKEYFKIVSR